VRGLAEWVPVQVSITRASRSVYGRHTGGRCIVVAHLGALALLGGDFDDVAVASAAAGAVKRLELHAAAAVGLCVCRLWLAAAVDGLQLASGFGAYQLARRVSSST
jgi:hypothetical protein